MGQKVHPIAFRLGVGRTWPSRWFSRTDYAALVQEDVTLRKFIRKALPDAGIARIEIERAPQEVKVTLHTSKPGVVIGKGGAGIETLKKNIEAQVFQGKKSISVSIHEVRQPLLSAEIVMQGCVSQIERRMPFRRILKQTTAQVMEAGAKGVKIQIGGRLNGSDIARTEKLALGAMPLHTIRADIDYSRGMARTTYGAIGIKVWINRGDTLEKQGEQEESQSMPQRRRAPRRGGNR